MVHLTLLGGKGPCCCVKCGNITDCQLSIWLELWCNWDLGRVKVVADTEWEVRGEVIFIHVLPSVSRAPFPLHKARLSL